MMASCAAWWASATQLTTALTKPQCDAAYAKDGRMAERSVLVNQVALV
jgi:hypothetical protein